VSHLGVGEKSNGKKEASGGVFLFIDRGERGGGPGPASWCQYVGDLPKQLGHGMVLGPLSRVTDQWASFGVLKTGVSPSAGRPHCSPIQPDNKRFSIFPNSTKFENCEIHLSIALKFTKLCKLVEWKIWNNFQFGRK
jgi:hypothetical protein